MANSFPSLMTTAKGVRTVAAMTVAIAGIGLAPAKTTIYVATNGNDSWTGTSTVISAPNGPKRTVNSALLAIRDLRSRNQVAGDGAEIVVRPGIYNLRENGISLTTADSGTANAPLVIRAEIAGTAILDGAQTLTRWFRVFGPSAAKISREARPYVWAAPLSETVFPNLGQLSDWNSENDEIANRQPTAPEVFEGDQRMTLARYPNTGYAQMERISDRNTFNNPAIVANLPGIKTPAGASDVWFVGMHKTKFFAEVMEKVANLNPTTGEVSLELTGEYRNHPTRHPEVTYADNNPQAKGRFQIVNSLYELDEPGEYYIDRTSRILYAWVKNSANRRQVAMSLMQAPIIGIEDASNVKVEGFVLQRTRHDGAKVTNSSNVTLHNITVLNVGNAGVRVLGGSNVSVTNSTIRDTGGTGVHMEGGNRNLLVPANFTIDSCDIRRTSRVRRMGQPMVFMKGVGMTLANSSLRENDHSAVTMKGNDLVVENNLIKDVCLDSSDAGAIYLAHSWTDWGTRIENNVIENVRRNIPSQFPNSGVYLDGAASGVTIRHNVFRNNMIGVDVLGGNYNVVTDNVFYRTNVGFKINDVLTGNEGFHNTLMNEANSVTWMNTAWQTRFPDLFALLTNTDPQARRLPMGNDLARNIVLSPRPVSEVASNWGTKHFQIWNNLSTMPERNTMDLNVETTDESQFVNPGANDFRLKPGAPLGNLGLGSGFPGSPGPDLGDVGSQIYQSFQVWRP
ncbi:MAG: right-handed parallel beta-helix repeat-containing protein [Fimbriimonadaceae bacterium]|nr:right-handed parallel beta-helix repeat-containing protein [Fimbriimonadaceae bacterium]